MDVLVKASGDLVKDERFYEWLISNFKNSETIFILCGGGTSITESLRKEGIPYRFGPQGREIESLEGKRLAYEVLQEQKIFTEKKLLEKGIKATVFVPAVILGDRIYHVNGDSYALALYPAFDRIYIVTLRGRTKSFPENLNKIEVVCL